MAKPPPKINPSDIAQVNIPEPQNSSMAKDERALFAHEESMQKSKLGLVGAIWGSKSEKPGNVAAIVLIVLLVFIGYVLYNHKEWAELFSDTIALLMSTVTLILGYLFGSSSNRE